MVVSRTCSFRKQDGSACRNAPMQDEDFCFWHSPEHAEEATEARRLGGLRRRKERITGGAYDFTGLENVADIRRLLEVAVVDTLGLESSIARSRTLAYLAQTALKALEVGEIEDRVRTIESVLRPRLEERAAQEKGGRGWRWRR